MVQDDNFFKDETPDKNPNAPKDYLAMFNRSILDQTKYYPDPLPVINLIHNENIYPLLTLMSYSLWQGKNKSKKTTVLALAIAAYISPNKSNDVIRFQREGEMGKVLFIDTEQGQSYAARTMKLILKKAGLEESENLIYCDFREFTPEEKLGMIKAKLGDTEGIKIIVIDGIVDLMEDFTISSQKCEMEIACEKDIQDKAQTIVECWDSRGLPFEKIVVRWNKNELPGIVQDSNLIVGAGIVKNGKLDVHSLSIEEHKALVQEIFKDNSEFNDRRLKDQIAVSNLKMKGNVTDTLKRQLIERWQNLGLIESSKGKRNANIFKQSNSIGEDI
jgi:hypothetical protein